MINPIKAALITGILFAATSASSAQPNPWDRVTRAGIHATPIKALVAAAFAAAKHVDLVAREQALRDAMGPLMRENVNYSRARGGSLILRELSLATRRWLGLAEQRMGTQKRPMNELVHDLLHEKERMRSRCRQKAATVAHKLSKLPAKARRRAVWNALGDARLTCGHTALSLIAHRSKGEETALRNELKAWPGLRRFCPMVLPLVKDLEKWEMAERPLSVERRCPILGVDTGDLRGKPPMAVVWTYALTQRLDQYKILSSAHLKILAWAR